MSQDSTPAILNSISQLPPGEYADYTKTADDQFVSYRLQTFRIGASQEAR